LRQALRKMWRYLVLKTWHQAEEERRAHLAALPPGAAEKRVLSLLLAVCFGLTLARYGGSTAGFQTCTGGSGNLLGVVDDPGLAELSWWVALVLCGYVLIPGLVARCCLQLSLRDLGLRVPERGRDGWVYALALGIVIPLTFLVSATSEFQYTYPFYRLPEGADRSRLWVWELLYALQFLGVEFLFRGLLVLGLRRELGMSAVFLAVLPYCMLHFNKPLLETLASIPAGLILGLLALKSRSILPGWGLHVSVALTMDLASLWRQGLL